MNTRFHYLYRDASNYKQWGEIVFTGWATDLEGRLTAALDRHEVFHCRSGSDSGAVFRDLTSNADDHCFHEFDSIETTDASVDDRHLRSVNEFVEEVERAGRSGWRLFDPCDERPSARQGEMKHVNEAVVHSDPEIMGGEPVFVGTRVPLKTLFDYLQGGDSLDEFLEGFPSVSREQAIAALEIARLGVEAAARAAKSTPS
jgi:uncharacterized protein (DUF433 family)